MITIAVINHYSLTIINNYPSLLIIIIHHYQPLSIIIKLINLINHYSLTSIDRS